MQRMNKEEKTEFNKFYKAFMQEKGVRGYNRKWIFI